MPTINARVNYRYCDALPTRPQMSGFELQHLYSPLHADVGISVPREIAVREYTKDIHCLGRLYPGIRFQSRQRCIDRTIGLNFKDFAIDTQRRDVPAINTPQLIFLRKLIQQPPRRHRAAIAAAFDVWAARRPGEPERSGTILGHSKNDLTLGTRSWGPAVGKLPSRFTGTTCRNNKYERKQILDVCLTQSHSVEISTLRTAKRTRGFVRS